MTNPSLRLGIRENLPQFSLLVLVNGFVGAILAGLIADRLGLSSAIIVVGVLTILSGIVVQFKLKNDF